VSARLIHPDKTAQRAVDACGGTYSPSETANGYAKGHSDALQAAMIAVQACDARTAALLDAAQEVLTIYDALLDDFRMGDPDALKALSDAILALQPKGEER